MLQSITCCLVVLQFHVRHNMLASLLKEHQIRQQERKDVQGMTTSLYIMLLITVVLLQSQLLKAYEIHLYVIFILFT